jgi:hypothetical protein
LVFRRLAAHLKIGQDSRRQDSDIFSEAAGLFGRFSIILDMGAHHGNIIRRLRPSALIHVFEPS